MTKCWKKQRIKIGVHFVPVAPIASRQRQSLLLLVDQPTVRHQLLRAAFGMITYTSTFTFLLAVGMYVRFAGVSMRPHLPKNHLHDTQQQQQQQWKIITNNRCNKQQALPAGTGRCETMRDDDQHMAGKARRMHATCSI